MYYYRITNRDIDGSIIRLTMTTKDIEDPGAECVRLEGIPNKIDTDIKITYEDGTIQFGSMGIFPPNGQTTFIVWIETRTALQTGPAYLHGLQPGEKVIETGNSAIKGHKGIIHISVNPGPTFGSKCVKWENGMSTGVTHGTRRVNE